jgi:hypothetical protein
MKKLQARIVLAFLGCLIFVLIGVNFKPAVAQRGLPGFDGSAILSNLGQLPDIQIRDFPAIPFSEELAAQLEAIGSQVSTLFEIGEMVNPTDILMVGNFDLFGFSDLSLENIAGLTNFDLSSISLEQFTGFLDNLTPAKLLEIAGLENLGGELIGDVPLLNELASQISGGQSIADLSVAEAVTQLPDFGDTPLSAVDPAALSNLSIGEAVPGLTNIPLQNIPDISNLPISSLSGVGAGNLSLGQMPIPLALVPGIRLGIADIALGDPESGDREQQRVRVVSGGITDRNMQMSGARCSGNSCPHFEISTADPQLDGSAWMDSTGQLVPDGFGPLCVPFSCKGPPGNHPFGPGARVLLRDIDQATGTAQVALSFAVCKVLPFIGKTCTPWRFPTPEGIPIAKIAEKSTVPFIVPTSMTEGEVVSNPVSVDPLIPQEA